MKYSGTEVAVWVNLSDHHVGGLSDVGGSESGMRRGADSSVGSSE